MRLRVSHSLDIGVSPQRLRLAGRPCCQAGAEEWLRAADLRADGVVRQRPANR